VAHQPFTAGGRQIEILTERDGMEQDRDVELLDG
jgi:hypothetical protein